MTTRKDKLVQLYADMAKHTEPECRHYCRCPLSCCSADYCDLAKVWAKEEWDVDLQPTGHPTLPYMGPTGCTVPPHMRPMCTLHTCSIQAFGFKPKDQPWTDKYYELRTEIDELELDLELEKQT